MGPEKKPHPKTHVLQGEMCDLKLACGSRESLNPCKTKLCFSLLVRQTRCWAMQGEAH